MKRRIRIDTQGLSSTPPAWMQQLVAWPEGGCTGASMSEICDGFALAYAVYGEALDDNSGLLAFAYLWRRFRPPWWGSDDHKDLVTDSPQLLRSLGGACT